MGIWTQGPENGRLSCDWSDVQIELDPTRGGRVSRLRLGAVDLLVNESVHAQNWGSTFWTSPQADWGWPPVAALDHEPYGVERAGESLVLTSGRALVGGRPLRVIKRVAPSKSRGAIEIEYVIENLDDEPLSTSAWEISRVPPGGLTFFVAGAREYTLVGPHGILPTTKELGVTWLDHRRFVPGQGAKLNADSRGGWLAHVVRSSEALVPNVLWLKQFEPVPLELQAPGEGVVELYADETGSYVEVENQSPYELIEPGGALRYQVTWSLLRLPRELDVSIGSTALLDRVRSVLEGRPLTDSL